MKIDISLMKYNTKTQKWYRTDKNIRRGYFYNESCLTCKEPFFHTPQNKGLFCTIRCSKLGEYNSFYGKKHTKESIEKTRQGNLGKTVSDETKEKIRQKRIGMEFSDEHKKNLSKSKSGKNHPFYDKKRPEHSKKMKKLMNTPERKQFSRERMKGENNHNWQGGLKQNPYPDEWTKELKTRIRKRDNYKCQEPSCKGISYILDVHHIDYDKYNCSGNNLITLCHSCHSRTNNSNVKVWYMDWYKTMNNKKLGECYE